MSDIKFEIKKSIGVIGQGKNGWNKEINVVSWNDSRPRIDIREWDDDHQRMSKGVTLIKEEVSKLKELLDGVDIAALY